MSQQTKNTEIKNNKNAELKARLAALGFKDVKRVGMNVLKQDVNETVFVKVTSEIKQFEAKEIDKNTGKKKMYDYVEVTNLETGEENLTYWLSGQPRYQLEQTPNYVGLSFAITYLGQEVIDGQKINQFDMFLLN